MISFSKNFNFKQIVIFKLESSSLIEFQKNCGTESVVFSFFMNYNFLFGKKKKKMKEIESSIFSQFSWLNPPTNWEVENDILRVEVESKTDFWRITHYDFIRDNGHFFFKKQEGEFECKVKIKGKIKQKNIKKY